MKIKTPLLVLATLALVACGNQDGDASSEDQSSSQTSTSQHGTSSQQSQGTSHGISSRDDSVDSDPDSSFDPEGIEEIAEAPEGVVLEDWTDEMKAILGKYLGGEIPPFLWMEELRVTYDNMDILQARGLAYEGALEDYYDALIAAGYQARIEDNRVYGRKFTQNGGIYVDGLLGPTYFSINYELDGYLYSWPEEGIQQIISYSYESAQTYLPPLAADVYIVESDIIDDVYILCLGENIDADTPAAYADLLRENRWTVVTGEEVYPDDPTWVGYWFARSLDNRVILTFYFDGAGVMIEMTHGEGEIYTTWADCVPAIEDFARTDLRLPDGLSVAIPEPEFADAVRYSIDRSARGVLNITIQADGNLHLRDLNAYADNILAHNGFTIDRSKQDEEFQTMYAIPEAHDFVLRLQTDVYYTDLDEARTTIGIAVQDYRIYEGYHLFYAWPEAQVNGVIAGMTGVAVPEADSGIGVWYAYRDYSANRAYVDVVEPGENALADYEAQLTDLSYTVSDHEGHRLAIDRTQRVQIEFWMENKELHLIIGQYVAPPVIIGSTATIDLTPANSYSAKDAAFSYVEWGGSPFALRVEKGSSSVTVGNYGDYLNPLRLYKNQCVSVTPEQGASIIQIDFYVSETTATGSFKQNAAINLSLTTIEGLTLVDYNASLGRTRYTVDEGYQASGISFTIDGQFILNEVVVTFAE